MDRREAFTGRQRRSGYIIHDALDRRHRGRGTAVCAPDVMGDGGDGCDPKGAGVLTTSTRYSRKRHTYTPSIPLRSPSASILLPDSSAPRSIAVCYLPFFANSCHASKFYHTPGALGTLFSNINVL